MFKFIKNWLDRLAKENEKNFGDGRLDCCDLNKPKNTNSQAANSNTNKKWVDHYLFNDRIFVDKKHTGE